MVENKCIKERTDAHLLGLMLHVNQVIWGSLHNHD